MTETITIELDEGTKQFYKNAFLARHLSTWVDMYKALHGIYFGDDISYMSDEEIIKQLGNKDIAKSHLSAEEFECYLKYYDDIYIKG